MGLSVNHGQSCAEAPPAWCCCRAKSVMEKMRPVDDSQNCERAQRDNGAKDMEGEYKGRMS